MASSKEHGEFNRQGARPKEPGAVSVGQSASCKSRRGRRGAATTAKTDENKNIPIDLDSQNPQSGSDTSQGCSEADSGDSRQGSATGGRHRGRTAKSASSTANKPNKQTIRRAEMRQRRSLEKAMNNLVRIPQEHRSETCKVYNPIIDGIQAEIKRMVSDQGESDIFQFQKLNSGSYFENLKVDTTNEFDFMFCIYGHDLEVEETEPGIGMVAVKLPNKNNSSLRNYIGPAGFLSPKKLLNRFRDLVERAIRTLKKAKEDNPFKGLEVKLDDQEDGCPAATLTVFKKKGRLKISIDLVLVLTLPKPWPKCTKGWDDNVTLWLKPRDIRALKNNALHVVAKSAPPDKDPDGDKLWRLSFSQTEKEIFNGQILNPTGPSNHATTCRKDCLRCLKYIKLQLRIRGAIGPHVGFASYHLKTVLLHAIAKRPGGWEKENLVKCVVYVIEELVSSIESRHLPHFFIPGYNLFDPAVFKGLEDINTVKEQFLIVKEDLNNGRLPEVLDAFSPSEH